MLVSHRKDGLIEKIKEMLGHSFVLDLMETTAANTMGFFEDLIEEHRQQPDGSRLSEIVPSVRGFFTPLPLKEAFIEFDRKYGVTKRKFVYPTFNEIRQILNLAQIKASATPALRLMTFDGDETLYRDGMALTDPEMAALLTDVLKSGITVAIVTAAGYGYDNTKYEARIVGLLEYFKQAGLPEEVLNRFHVLGGECNYLFRCGTNPETDFPMLNAIHATEWYPTVASWEERKIQRLLDVAEECMNHAITELRMRARIIRKPRSVGVVSENLLSGALKASAAPLRRESLDETVLRVQMALKQVSAEINIPYCAFNGGQDVWVDCGNKRVGVDGLQDYFGLQPDQCLHVGDQFLNTGNDFSARDSCPCTWIAEPAETKYIIRYILRQLKVYPDRSLSEVDIPDATTA